jgi:MFS_1 like family
MMASSTFHFLIFLHLRFSLNRGGAAAAAVASEHSRFLSMRRNNKNNNPLRIILTNLPQTNNNSPFQRDYVSILRGGEIIRKPTSSNPGLVNNTNTTSSVVPRRYYTPSVPMLIRFLFLCYYSSLGALMPYLPVYYHSLGHGGLIIGLLGAIKPLTTFLVAPLWGIVSDAATNKFPVLYLSFGVSLLGQLLMAYRTNVSFLLIMVFVTAIFNAPVKSLMDSIVLDHLPVKADYGRMRLWGQLGFGLGSSSVGVLLSKSSSYPVTTDVATDAMKSIFRYIPVEALRPLVAAALQVWRSITGYKILFLGHAALSIPTWWALTVFERLDKEKQQRDNDAASISMKQSKKSKQQQSSGSPNSKSDQSGTKIMEGLRLLVTDSDAILFFFLVFIVGTSSGVIENFAYVRLREVGGAGREMGLSRLVSSASGVPMFWYSGQLTELLGADRVLTLSLASYVVRFYLYAVMTHPYHALPAEALRGLTFAAFWSTGTIYAHRISPPGMSTTMVRDAKHFSLFDAIICVISCILLSLIISLVFNN